MVRLKALVTPALVMEGKTLLRQVSCNLIEYENHSICEFFILLQT